MENPLIIDPETYIRNYNWNFTQFMRIVGSGDYQYDYLPWAIVHKEFRLRHNDLKFEVISLTNISNELNREQRLTNEIATRDITTTDYREKKRQERAKNQAISEICYESRGTVVECYLTDLEENLSSGVLHYPVMDTSNNPISNPTSREIADSIRRAEVKAIAMVTGLGLRAFTREDVDSDQGNRQHIKFRTLIKISDMLKSLENYGGLPVELMDKPDFGTPLYQMNRYGAELKKEITKYTQGEINDGKN